MLIRQETEKDYSRVYELIKTAFAAAEHSNGNEQDLVSALRKGAAFVPQLSLVAEIDGQIVGHILYTEAMVGRDTVLALAPLSVSPAYQRQGIGTALMAAGHKIAKELGYPYALVLGSTTYYPRCGYRPAAQFGIQAPPGIPAANFMALPLQEPAQPVCGPVTYAQEFGIESI